MPLLDQPLNLQQTSPDWYGPDQADLSQQPTQPVQQSLNPDAPQQPLVDDQGNPTTYHGKALALVQEFDNFVNSGGDITKLGQDVFHNVQSAVQSLPDFDNKTQSPSVMYALYKQGKERNLVTDIFQAPGFTPKEVAEDPLAAAAATAVTLTGAIGEAVQKFDYGKAFKGVAQYMWDNTLGKALGTSEDLARAALGDFSFANTLNLAARQTSASVQGTQQTIDSYKQLIPGGKDLWDLISLATQRAETQDPDKAAQLDFRQSEILRQQLVRDQQYAKNATDARDAVVAQYKAVGANDFAKRLATAQPTDTEMFVAGQVADPLTYLTLGAEPFAKAIGEQFFKAGVRTSRLAEATAAIAKVEDGLTATSSAKTNLQYLLTEGPAMTDTTRAGYQANLARLNTVEQNLLKDHAAAMTEYTGAIADVNKQMDTMAQASPLRQYAGQSIQELGNVMQTTGKVANYVANLGDNVVEKFFPNLPDAAKEALAKYVDRGVEIPMRALSAIKGSVFGPVGTALGAGAPEIVGGLTKGLANTLESAGKTLGVIGEQYALGQQTLPYWRAVADKLDGVPAWLASKMDNQLVYAIPSAATGGAMGGAMGGGMSLLQGGGNRQKFGQGFVGGALIGAAGGGLGQLTRFNSAADLRQAAIGDRSRFIGSLTPQNKAMFLRLAPDYQLAISVYGMAHPDSEFRFFADPNASNGKWTANNPKSTIDINVAGDNPMQAVAAHEVGHHLAAHGLESQAVSDIIGNPVTGQAGIMNKLDDTGKPLTEFDPVTGSRNFVQNDAFENYKANYNARLKRDNPGAPPATDRDVALEMFADLHAQQMTNPETLQKTIRGYVPSDLVSTNVTKNWLTKMGVGADAVTGNPIPTSTLQQAKGLQDAITNYYRQAQAKRGDVNVPRGTDTQVSTGATKGSPQFDMLQTQLDASGDFHRNPDGTIMTDLAGRPMIKTPKQADADAAKLGQAIGEIYRAQPGLEGTEADNFLKVVKDADGRQFRRGQRIPEAVFGELEKSNQFNANQLLNLRKADGVMQRNDGTMMRAVYNTASKGGKYKTLAARERDFVPVWTEVSLKTDQVNIKGFDPEELQSNLAKGLRSQMGQDLYAGKGVTQMGPALADARTYLDNLANDRPGETGIGLQKKAFLNRMFGFPADANPSAGDLAKRATPVIKSFRLDRLNRIREVPGQAVPFHERTYGQLTSFFQPRSGEVAPEQAQTAQDFGTDYSKYSPQLQQALAPMSIQSMRDKSSDQLTQQVAE